MMTEGLNFQSWPAEKTAKLERMWWDGLSAAEISIALNVSTPKAVREKARRSGFMRNPELKLQAEPSLFEVPNLMLPMMREGGELVTIATVRAGHECRWMEAQEPTPEAPLCGRPVFRRKQNESWCEHHYRRVFPKVA